MLPAALPGERAFRIASDIGLPASLFLGESGEYGGV
jgi:hypothetical protein